MSKNNTDRVAQALAAIQRVCGLDEEADIRQKLSIHPQKAAIESALALDTGARGLLKDRETTLKRDAVRGCLLAGLVLQKIILPNAPGVKRELLRLPRGEVERRLQRAFPFKALSGQFAERAAWDPSNFTTPVSGLASSYQFVVHSIMADPSKVASFGMGSTTTKAEWDAQVQQWRSGISKVVVQNAGSPMQKQSLFVNFAKQYLQDPTIITKNIISASVIDDAHHASYYPFGFILQVPPECIYSTSSSDQSVTNRAANAVQELQRVHDQKGGSKIESPATILGNTNGKSGETGYNEIVLVGRSPEGRKVEVIGLFVKCHPNGNHYVRSGQTTPYLTDELVKLIKGCVATRGWPVVKIADSSSAPSTFSMTI